MSYPLHTYGRADPFYRKASLLFLVYPKITYLYDAEWRHTNILRFDYRDASLITLTLWFLESMFENSSEFGKYFIS